MRQRPVFEGTFCAAHAVSTNSLPHTRQKIFSDLALCFQLNEICYADQLKVIDHVGFVLISLFDGFAIVSALDLHAPGWLIAVIAVAAVGVGIYGINLRKKTLKMQTM